MDRWRWPVVGVIVVVAALSALGDAGLRRGADYGRYVAAEALVERRTAAIDGAIDGLRPAAGGPLDGVAYVGGHYYPTEPPVLTWLAAPLYALGALAATLQPGVGWGPAVVSLLGPLLLLALLLGVARLIEQFGPLDNPLFLLVVVAAIWSLKWRPNSSFDWGFNAATAWLGAAALLVWLLVGMRWESRPSALAHGLLAGLLAAASVWLAPAALAALVVTRRKLPWRGLGLLPPLLLVGGWQLLVFGRPWRTASQFAVAPAPWAPDPLVVAAVAVVAVVWLINRTRWFGAFAVVCLLAGAGHAFMGEGPWRDRSVALAGVVVVALCGIHYLVPRRPGVVRSLLWGAVAAGWAVRWAWRLASAPEPPRLLLAFRPEQQAVLALIVVLVGLGVVARPRPRLGGVAAVGAAVLVGWLVVGGQAAVAAAPGPSLIPPFTAPATDGASLTLWRLTGGARPEGERLLLPDAGAVAESPIVAARPGERYCAAAGPEVGQVVLVWEDDGKRVIEQQGGQGPQARLCFAAPLGATGVRLRLVGGAAPARVAGASLWADGVRVAPLPDFATAALAFTFDWESAMGGPIHSKGGSGAYEGEGGGPALGEGGDPVAVAVERGARMRRGAEVLADLLRPYGIRGTFYATGYNLLAGNPEQRTFAGDPTYRWANRANGWASDYWRTRRWYGDDPYGTEATNPEWYFASLTRRLAAEGYEIETHTFGHLYVRGASPDELSRDLGEWNAAARALGLAPARSFAFPWQSSNSVRAPHYQRLIEAGITSVTRMYKLREGYTYELDQVEEAPGLTIYPDTKLDSTAAGGAAARRLIDELLLRRGYQSLWTHPEEVVDPGQVAVWRAVVAYAAEARGRGLWVAPLVEIVDRVRAGRQVEVVPLRDGGVTRLWVTNGGPSDLDGVVIEAGVPGSVQVAGPATAEQRGERVRLDRLAPRQPVELSVAGSAAGR